MYIYIYIYDYLLCLLAMPACLPSVGRAEEVGQNV